MSTPFFKSFVFSCFFCYFVTFIFGPAPFAFRSFLYAVTLDAGTLNVQLECFLSCISFWKKKRPLLSQIPTHHIQKRTRLQRISCNRINRAYKQQSSKRQIRFKKNSILLSIIDRKKVSLAYYPMQKKESGCDSGQREIILIFYCIVSMCFTVVPFGQGFKDMSPPTKELMKLTLEQKLAHGGHPVLLSTMIEAFSSCKMQKLSNFNSFCISVHKLVFSVSLCYTLFTRRNTKW